MNQFLLMLGAFIGGVFLAIQGGLNAQLGALLRNPLLASFFAFAFSTLFAFLAVLPSGAISAIKYAVGIPWYLWFLGAVFSVLGISLYYYTIPRLGIGTMISLGLGGQIVFSVFAAKFGWFGHPVEDIDLRRMIGLVATMVGVVLINYRSL